MTAACRNSAFDGSHFFLTSRGEKIRTYGTKSQWEEEDTNKCQKLDILAQSCRSSALDDRTCAKQLQSNIRNV